MILVQFDQTGPLPVGSRVSGIATWTPDNNKQPRGIKVALRWRTEGRGSTDQRVVSEVSLPVGPISAGVPVQAAFDLNLPPDGPVSYNGNLLRVIWELLVEIDEPWALNEKIQQPIIVTLR